VTPHTSARAGAFAALAAAGMLAALLLGRPELAALAAPFALALTAGLAAGERAAPRLEAAVEVGQDRALTGDVVPLRVTLRADAPVEQVDVVLALPAGLAPAGAAGVAVRLAAGEGRVLELGVRCERWGVHRVGGLVVRAGGGWRLLAWERRLEPEARLKVLPRAEELRDLVRPLGTTATSGGGVARARGEGIEFADVRPFLPGDRPRSVNWRATARLGARPAAGATPGAAAGDPWVTERHPERARDVVLFLDTFEDVGGAGGSTLDRAVAAAAAIAAAYLRERDRVGVVSFGGFVRWLAPVSGMTGLYRLLDTLLETRVHANVAWKDVRRVPARALPPHALVIALTPLVDTRGVAALLDLRARGHDLAVIDVEPPATAPPARPGRRGPGARRALPARTRALAGRVWALERAALRHRYQRLGVAVVAWREPMPAGQVLLELEASRHRAAALRP